MQQFHLLTCAVMTICLVHASATLLDQLNYIVSQNQYASQNFQLENIMSTSLDLAVQSCQNDFKWQRWNCPSSDFFVRRTSQPTHIDREDAYVTAITTAAIIHTITQHCSAGAIAECGCQDKTSNHCSDDPATAIEIYEKNIQQNNANDFTGAVHKHNYKVVANVMRNSLLQECHCNAFNGNVCMEQVCQHQMKPFAVIANEIFQLYDDSTQVNCAANTRIIWSNIPLDTLLFVDDSPNYCEPDAIPDWNGMRGRHCSMAFGDTIADAEQDSCTELCRACGYRIRTHTLVIEQHCNCKFVWGFQLQCEKCVSVEQQYFCY